jgi:hypothetical protein
MDKTFIFQEKQGKSLEDLFFLEKDKMLIESLHKIEKMKETKIALAKVSGITNDGVLQKLVDLNVRPEIVASLAIIPLIEVAWADGSVDEKEKKAILNAAGESFISKESPDFNLLQSWMKRKPGPGLLKAWMIYIKGLCEQLNEYQKKAIKKDLIGHAREVAEATGGLLGLGYRISKKEQEMLDKLASAFE